MTRCGSNDDVSSALVLSRSFVKCDSPFVGGAITPIGATKSEPMFLPTPPSNLIDTEGVARFGAYAGPLGPVDFAGLGALRTHGPLWTAAHHKRWVYAFAASDRHIIAAAIVHLGYAGTAFVSIVDRRTRAMLYDHTSFTLPHLVHVARRAEEGCDAHFRGPGTRVAFTRPLGSSRYLLSADTPRASLRATFETMDTPLPITAVSPVPNGAVNVTTKRVLMPSHGAFSVDDESHCFDEAWGGMDYTNGLLARDTSWRWAFGMGRAQDGRHVAFNFVDGFNGGRECAIWLDQVIVPAESARFEFDARRPLGSWQITTPDGRVSLTFRGDAMHEERVSLGLVRSAFVQPIGHFSGQVALPDQPEANLADVCGVVENQSVTW